MTTASVVRQAVIDFICLAFVWIPVLLLDQIGKPYQRGFYCDDASIRYPFRDSTVTNVVLYSYGMGLPIVMMIIVEVVRWRDGSTNKRQTRQNKVSTVQLGSYLVPSLMVELIHVIAIFLFGAGCSQITTDFAKYSIGRLRPHFIDVCQPEDLDKLCPPEAPPLYITQFTCTNSDAHKLRDARLSFPSGHASFSAYTMVYLAFYLQRRMNWSGSSLLRPTLQIACLMLAWYTGLSRVSDYKHHWSDVLSGFLIGIIAASLTARYVSTLFDRPTSSETQLLLPRTREDLELDQNHLSSSSAK